MSSKFPRESVSDALERSLRNNPQVKAVNSAVVAAARLLAKRIDSVAETGFLDENGKLDNVSVPTFLKYCQSLGLTLDEPRKAGRPPKQKPVEENPGPSADSKVLRMQDFMKRFG